MHRLSSTLHLKLVESGVEGALQFQERIILSHCLEPQLGLPHSARGFSISYDAESTSQAIAIASLKNFRAFYSFAPELQLTHIMSVKVNASII